MNNKGLTLVELIAVLIILSVVAVIVTPNIYGSIRNYKNQLYVAQMDSIKEAGKNWAADNIGKINDDTSLSVSIKELQEGGYIKGELDDPKHGGKFDKSNTFVLIECEKIEDETNNYETNYKYTYGAYYDVSEYLEQRAIKYHKDNFDNDDKGTYTTTLLKEKKYITSKNIKKTDGTTVSIPNKTITVTETRDGENTNYEATIS